MAKLDIAEKRLPQDGRITVKLAGHGLDIRLSTIPSAHGERVVLRLLDTTAGQLSLKQINMPAHVHNGFSESLGKPHGIILVTGPTGSGKTTTLYAGLSHINDRSRNILTIEDPVEYVLPGIGQTQVNSKIDMTFSRGLRAILRQDPDVVMIGEIRDQETAAIAVQASLTGHLVLSTLHTNTAIGAVTRLQDMGIEPFLLSSSITAVMSQRLVRLLCDHCKTPDKPTPGEQSHLNLDESDIVYRPNGCEHCHNQGYRGRSAIYEWVEIDHKMRQLIHEDVGEQVMEAHARSVADSITEHGRKRVLAGDTSIEEVMRVTTAM
jgi:general secretion pathway protein E